MRIFHNLREKIYEEKPGVEKQRWKGNFSKKVATTNTNNTASLSSTLKHVSVSKARRDSVEI